MTKVFYDSDNLKNKFLRNLDSVMEELQSAKRDADSFDVPSYYWDYFKYKSYLKGLSSDIGDIIDLCKNVERWIDSSMKSYNLISENAIDVFNSIEEMDIKERSSIVIKY